MPNESQPATTWAAILGFVAVVGGGLIRAFTRRKKDAHDNDASLEEIRNKGIIELLTDYRQQVSSLRAEILQQGIRHVEAMREAEARYESLESEHTKVLEELYGLRALVKALQDRMDGD